MAAYQVHSATSAVACLAATAFFLFGIHGPLAKVALDVAPKRQRAAFVSTYLTVGHISSALTPAVIGFLVSESGTFASGFTLMIVALGLSALCLIGLSRMARNEAQSAVALG
jgi:MFS-type transporter involved in bile tolerance (Atg22 family)